VLGQSRGVNGALDGGGGKDQRCGKHGDGDRLAKAPRCAHEHLLRNVVPSVQFQELLLIPRKRAVSVCFEEDAGARPDVRLVELALVEAPLPAAVVQCRQRLPTRLNAVKPVASPAGHLRGEVPPKRRYEARLRCLSTFLLFLKRHMRVVQRVPRTARAAGLSYTYAHHGNGTALFK